MSRKSVPATRGGGHGVTADTADGTGRTPRDDGGGTAAR